MEASRRGRAGQPRSGRQLAVTRPLVEGAPHFPWRQPAGSPRCTLHACRSLPQRTAQPPRQTGLTVYIARGTRSQPEAIEWMIQDASVRALRP